MPVKKPPVVEKKGLKGEAQAAEEGFSSLIERCEQLIDRLNHLYRMYVNGVEKNPPREVRAQLEALMMRLSQMPKAKVDTKFRYQALTEKFSLYSGRWDRMLRAKEKSV